MSNPFKKITTNAQNTKSTLYASEEKTASSYALACASCGAPRPKKSNLATCDYCKAPFMNTNTVINADS
ncbi:hypothetical protein [Cellulophaga tyrosinoxydans]|uniref:Uncharacterized protein n=1 Tax=Cellulophaga tyrosinoxydans TaxID=504486 RepID=A0A1W2AXJ1_9FLAO|nr:hypothetical protein [Cellulophaga tyrosinoxydans]SMC65334.1 hypothetical protein SAMN05660703_2286 [Cellulophaga tyrosinoxydans]